jgi:hypothetical protein
MLCYVLFFVQFPSLCFIPWRGELFGPSAFLFSMTILVFPEVKPITKHLTFFPFLISYPFFSIFTYHFLITSPVFSYPSTFSTFFQQAMADAILSALASTIMGNLNSSFLQELGLAGNLETERENLNRTIRTIRAVLQDAEEKQWKSEPIKVWLGDLKDAAYDADDLLDEFANEARWRQQRRVLKNRVRYFLSSNHNQPVFRQKMVRKIKNVREKLDAIPMERQKFHLFSCILIFYI